MKICAFAITLAAFLPATYSSGQKEAAAFQLAPSTYTQHYSVWAANSDPQAKTLAEIAAVNLRLAEQGDVKAALPLGLAYMQGYGVPKDPVKAEHWLSIGAVHPEEQELLASFYRSGDYLPQSATKADFWYRRAGRPGDLFELAKMYITARPSQVAKAAPILVKLLDGKGTPEVRRAQLELGNFVLDGTYSAGDDAAAQVLNLKWARSIAQELLGQSEYNIALDFEFGREGVPRDHAMWVGYCEHAAGYNIDLAQEFLGKAMLQGEIPGASSEEGYAWIKLASDKRNEDRKLAQALADHMNADAKLSADSFVQAFSDTRQHDGAYYRTQDPLRDPTEGALNSMQADDPDVQMRQAFLLEQQHTPESYTKALAVYRSVRNNSHPAAMAALGQSYLRGSDGLTANPALGHLWLDRAAKEGYKPVSHPAYSIERTPSP